MMPLVLQAGKLTTHRRVVPVRRSATIATKSYVTYYLIAASLLLKVLERQKVNDRPANLIYIYLLLRFISESVVNHLRPYLHCCLLSAS